MKGKWILIIVIALALVAVCAGLGAVAWFSFGRYVNSGTIQLGPINASHTAEDTEQQDFAVAGPAHLDVETPFGNITVTGGEGDQISVTAHKKAYGASQEQADQALENLTVTMTQEGDRVTIRVEDNQERLRLNNIGTQVDFTITVPTETTTVLTTRSGDVEVSGTSGKTDLSSDFGAIEITNVAGGVSANSRSGKVTARQISLLETENEGLVGDVSLRSDFGAITLEDAQTGKVTLFSSSGDITLANVQSDGDVSLETNYGSLSFNSGTAASLDADTRSGGVRLTSLTVDGLVTAHSDFGDVDLTQVDASGYDLSSNSGKIDVNGASGSVKAESGFGDIQVTGGQNATLNLKTSSGGIEYRGSLGSGPHNIQTDFGEVRLVLPGDSKFDFDLSTDFGDIRSDFDIQIDGEPDESHWQGSINGGGGLLKASTKNGGIAVEIGE